MRFFSKHTFNLSSLTSRAKPNEVPVEKYITKNPEQNIFCISPTTEEKPFKNGENVDINEYASPKKANCLIRRIHILSWIKDYNQEKAIADLIAGITLGLTIIPQSIAYAALAGLSSEYGLYSAFIGSIIYVFFGTIPQVSIGPTSLMALMVLQFCADKPVQFVIVLAFLAGLVELLMGVFELGFIVNFIPGSVNKAFTTATAMIIVLSQVKNLLGIKIKGFPSFNEFFSSIKMGDATLGITCIVVLLILRKLSQLRIEENTPTKKFIKKTLWYLSISRNALVVFGCALTTYFWIKERSREAVPYALSANAESAKVSVHLPPFAFEFNNTTYIFVDIVRELGSAIIVVPLVAVLANVAIAKAFVNDGTLDASQEMLTLGLCNIAGSFFSAMPTCGAFTRSAVSHSSGVRTPMAGVYVGLIVFSALSVLTPYFKFIPKSCLSAVLIAAVVFMMEFSVCKHYWKTNKKDFFSWICTFIVCVLMGVEVGLFFGILINMLLILLRLGKPTINVVMGKVENQTYVLIVCKTDIYYSGVEHLRTKILSACVKYRYDFPIVIDCSRFEQFDTTFVEMIRGVAKDLHKKDTILVLKNLKLETQKLLSEGISNLRFCDGEISAEDFSNKL